VPEVTHEVTLIHARSISYFFNAQKRLFQKPLAVAQSQCLKILRGRRTRLGAKQATEVPVGKIRLPRKLPHRERMMEVPLHVSHRPLDSPIQGAPPATKGARLGRSNNSASAVSLRIANWLPE